MSETFASRFKSLCGRLIRFGRSACGTVTVEFVIWMPILVLILAFTADACKLYLTQASMWDVARDAARRMSTGQLTASTATDYVKGQLLYYNEHYTITPRTVTTCTGSVETIDEIVNISVPVKNASVFGVLAAYGGFTGATIAAQITMRAENSGGSC